MGCGCGVGDSLLPADFAACPAESAPPEAPAAPTYYQDVAPILDARCAGCHVEGGHAPFALTSYDDAFHYAGLIGPAVANRQMPPWQPNDCCNHYLWDRTLTPSQIATITAWVDAGAPAGDPATPGMPLPDTRARLSRVDATLTMPEGDSPTPKIGVDDSRCFLLEWPAALRDHDFYVTGIEVRPGNREVVHHVATLLAAADEVDDLRARDAADDGAGWDCTGFGLDFTPTGSIGGWTPGDLALELPGGIGRKVPAGSAVVLQVHYDTGRGVAYPDQTSIDVMIADQVEREATGAVVGNPQWLLEDGMRIAPDDPDAMFWFAYDPTVLMNGGDAFQIWGVNIHMHELGSRGSLAILRADGTTDCLLDIPQWDFRWLSDYWLAEPVTVYPGDRVYLECHFDNTAENQKIVHGERETPHELHWGADMEMCGGILYTTKLEGGV